MNYKKYLIIFFIIVGVVGCSNSQLNEENTIDEPKESDSLQDLEELFDGSDSMTDLGSYSFGLVGDIDFDEIVTFEYTGEEIRIPYHAMGMSEDIFAELGLFFMVNGVVQPTRLELEDGSLLSDTNYMHQFALAFEEIVYFDVVFTPISGEVGERVGFISAALLRPDFLPEGTDYASFGGFHRLNATIPFEIDIKHPLTSSFTSYTDVMFEDFSHDQDIEEIVREVGGPHVEDVEGYLDTSFLIDLLPNTEQELIIAAQSGKINVDLRILGGLPVKKRVTLFVNHQPVSINGADFIELQMERGKVATIPLEIELDNLNELNTIYAVAMTTGLDYHLQDIYKTPTLLLVDES